MSEDLVYATEIRLTTVPESSDGWTHDENCRIVLTLDGSIAAEIQLRGPITLCPGGTMSIPIDEVALRILQRVTQIVGVSRTALIEALVGGVLAGAPEGSHGVKH